MTRTILIIAFIFSCLGVFGQSKSNKSDTIEKTILKNNEVLLNISEILNGKIKTISEKWNYNDGKTDSMFYFFNELGLLIIKESSLFSLRNQKAVYTYNSDNQIIKANMYDEDGKKSDSTEFFYENGNLIKRIQRYPPPTSKVLQTTDYFVVHYTYDIKGNLIERKDLRKDKNSEKEI